MATTVGAVQARERIRAALDAIDTAHDVLRATSSDLVGNDFRVDVAECLGTQQRVNRGLMYRVFAELADPPDDTGPTGAVRTALWRRLRIPPREITRRFRLAARIRPRRTLTGEPILPELPELAAAIEAGAVGDDHIRAVCQSVDLLPAAVPPTDVARAERALVAHARRVDAGIVTKLGQRIADHLNPDGLFSDEDRARRRGLNLGPRVSTACPGSPGCSTRKPAPTSKSSPPQSAPATTNPTPPHPGPAMSAALRNAATTR